MHANIPTTYRGIRFRSRLESKWARMFDLFGWSWEYEPLDLNGWIPDFLIRAKRKPILVEVKPILTISQEVVSKIESAFPRPPANRESWDPPYDVLIAPLAPFDYIDEPCIGWITDDWCNFLHINGILGWQYACPFYPPEAGQSYGLGSGSEGLWHNRVHDLGGKRYGRDYLHTEDLRLLWNEATNASQWRAPR